MGEVLTPLPFDCEYVGNDIDGIRVRPSPWLNPYASNSPSEEDAAAQVIAFVSSRAEISWLFPLSCKMLLVQPGIGGAHA